MNGTHGCLEASDISDITFAGLFQLLFDEMRYMNFHLNGVK